MTPDQLLESQGLGYTKVSDWCSDIIDETVDKEAIVSAFSAQKTGLFNANEFRIFYYDAEYSEEDYAEYVLSEGKLTLTAVSELYKSEWDSILPVTFSK